MRYKKILTFLFLVLFVSGFVSIQMANAMTLDEIKIQIDAIAIKIKQLQIDLLTAKIKELQKQLDILIKNEPTTSTSTVKSIAIISPNDETWAAGKTYDIKWESSGYSSETNVQIRLTDDRYDKILPRSNLKIADTTNSGIYSWKVPDLLESYPLYGSLYKIVIDINDGSDEKSDTSNYFTISQAIPSYLNLISPMDGEILKTGENYIIKWDSLGMENYKINITLQKANSSYTTIANNIDNNSFYEWKVNLGLFGSDYKILIEAYDNNGTLINRDLNDYNFTIIQ